MGISDFSDSGDFSDAGDFTDMFSPPVGGGAGGTPPVIVSPSGVPLNSSTGTPDGLAKPGTRLISWQQIIVQADPDYWRRKLRPWWYEFSNGRRFDWDEVSIYGPQSISPPGPPPPPPPPPGAAPEDLLTEAGQLLLTEGGDDIEIT